MAHNKTARNHQERYYYAYLTNSEPEGYQSNHTPQHITLTPPFIASKQDVLGVAIKTAAEFEPFEIESGESSMFGPNSDIPVILIKPSNLLQAIHFALLKKLKERNILISDPQFIGDKYTPHIALKKFHPNITEGKRFNFDHIAVMHKYKNIKTVLAKDILGENNEK